MSYTVVYNIKCRWFFRCGNSYF